MSTHARTKAAAKPEVASARVTLLMTPTEKKSLFAKAAAEGFGVSEYLRRKAFDHEPDLDALVDQVRESTARAIETVNQAIAQIQARQERTSERESQIRAEVATELASWTPEEQRSVANIFGNGGVL